MASGCANPKAAVQLTRSWSLRSQLFASCSFKSIMIHHWLVMVGLLRLPTLFNAIIGGPSLRPISRRMLVYVLHANTTRFLTKRRQVCFSPFLSQAVNGKVSAWISLSSCHAQEQVMIAFLWYLDDILMVWYLDGIWTTS